MCIVQKVVSYLLVCVDILCKVMGKKKCEVLEKEFEGFFDGMQVNGFFLVVIKVLWDIILLFVDYVFNKLYVVGYGMVFYWMVYFKVNYFVEYMVGLLMLVGDDKDKVVVYLVDCCKFGIIVFLFDVNEFGLNFVLVG